MKTANTMQEDRITQITVLVKASNAEPTGRPGEWRIELEGRMPTDQENELLRSLFPHLTEQAYILLYKEALLAAVVTQVA